MIPSQSLSNPTITGNWLSPDDRTVTKTTDYENGGIALNDPSAGLNYQVWTLRLEIIEEEGEDWGIGYVYLGAEEVAETMLFSGTGITEASLAFDQNMNPFVGYMQMGVAKFYWYDTVMASMVHSELPAGSTSPRACMDDKRKLQTTPSDVIMCYTRDRNLYFRAQRDRYTVEYLLKEDVPAGQVINIGMHDRYRLQIMVGLFE